MSEEEKSKREPISNTERLTVRQTGGRNVVTIPKAWFRSFPFFKREPLIFDAHIETENGRIFIVLEKVIKGEL